MLKLKKLQFQAHFFQTVMMIPKANIKQDGIAVRSSVTSKTLVLAASTLFASEADKSDYFGFIISYRVRVKLSVAQSPLKTAVVAQVPVFIVASNAKKSVSIIASPSDKLFRNRRYQYLSRDK